MRLPLLTAVLMAGAPLGMAAAQVSASHNPVKNPAPKGPPVKVLQSPTTLVPIVFSVAGSDDCSMASTNDAISGPGTFSMNTTTATTGAPVGSCGAIGNDVWFYWTATTTGVASISTCAGVTSDSAIAIWADGTPAGSCPTTQIACVDDACGVQTIVTWPVTAGTNYFLEVGGFAGTQYSGTFDLAISVPPANDDCSTPTVISGPGPHPFDNVVASAGAQGQAEAICNFFSATGINNDVWYTWTSGFTGTARVETCGGSGADTKIAAYNGAGCPAGAAIGCNDDACGLQSRVDFPVVSGNQYTIQLGLFPFTTTGGVGTFTITQFIAPMNDTCMTPSVVVGNGPHAFDTTSSTTGVEGQNEPLCFAFSTSALYNDSWFTWTATGTSTFEISLCGSTTYDSRVAVYNGAGCPMGAAIACNDDSCGLVSAACFSAVAGQSYTIQIGAFATTGSGTGTFQFTPVAPPTSACAPVDDGSTENAVGWTNGGTFAWMAGYGIIGQTVTVSSVQTTYATPLFPGGYTPQCPVTVAVWEDPNDDGNPADAILLGMGTAAVSLGSVDSDVFQIVALSGPVLASGIFFVGAFVTHNAGEFPSPLDQSGGGTACGSGPGSYFFGANAPTIDIMNLGNNQFPPQSVTSAGFPGNYLVRPDCGPGNTGTAFCFGDGTGVACPCGNNGVAGNGCANSVNPAGASLTATGVATVGANDTVVLHGSGMPNSSVLYFQGTAQIAVVFGDGLRCAGGSVIRLGTKANSGGMSQYPDVGDQSVSVRGMVPSGSTRVYQAWYRNAAPTFCPTASFNLSNGLSIAW